MSSFFNLDNPVLSALNKIVDMVLLSVVYIIICIPIVTIGPATTALYYTVAKNIRKERSYPFREFFSSFKNNFKQGLITTLILIVVFVVLIIDLQFVKVMDGTVKVILTGIFWAMLLITSLLTLYIFPYLSRFEVTIKSLFINSIFLVFKHLPSSILMLIIVMVGFIVSYIFPFILIITPALIILLQSFLMERIFKKYMPEKSGEANEQGIDEWYLD